MVIRPKVSVQALLVLLYVLAILLLAALLVRGHRHDLEPFSLVHATAGLDPGGATLTLQGDNFHAGVQGILTRNLGNERALLWQLLPAVPTRSVDVQANLALASCYGRRLVSFARQEGAPPELLGSLELPDTITQIKILGDLALVATMRHAGLALVDLRDPGNLQLLAHYPLPGLVTSMVAEQNIVYYVNLHQGLGRIDLSAANPAPEPLVNLESPWRMTLHGQRLVVVTLKGGVHLFDITRDGRLAAVGGLALSQDIRGAALTEDVLGVACADGMLYLYSVASWPDLGEPVQIQLPGRPFQLERVPDRPAIAVSLSASGVVLVDVHRPEAPQVGGHLQTPRTFLDMSLHSGAIWATNQAGLGVFDLAAIESDGHARVPAEVMLDRGFFKLYEWNARTYGLRSKQLVALGGESAPLTDVASPLLAVADGDGVELFAQGEHGQAEGLGHLPVEGGGSAAWWQNNILYVVNRAGLQIFAGDRPEAMTALGALPLPGSFAHLGLLGSRHLLVANQEQGLLVLDVSDPRRPVQVASLPTFQHLQPSIFTYDLLIDGDRAFVAQGAGGVHVIDVSRPTQPKWQEIIDTPGTAKKMVLHDGLLLVADTLQGVFMIDVKDRKRSLALGSWPVPLRVEQLAVAGDQLIVSNYISGTWQLPLPQRVQGLELVNGGELRGSVGRFARGQSAYLYDGRTTRQARVDGP